MRLTTTSSGGAPGRVSVAVHTSAIPPWPMRVPSRYRPTSPPAAGSVRRERDTDAGAGAGIAAACETHAEPDRGADRNHRDHRYPPVATEPAALWRRRRS